MVVIESYDQISVKSLGNSNSKEPLLKFEASVWVITFNVEFSIEGSLFNIRRLESSFQFEVNLLTELSD